MYLTIKEYQNSQNIENMENDPFYCVVSHSKQDFLIQENFIMMSMMIQFSNIAQNIMVLIQIHDPFFLKVNIYGLIYDSILIIVFTIIVLRGTEFSLFFQKDTAVVFSCFSVVELVIVGYLLWHEIDFEINMYVSSDYYFVFIFGIRVLNNIWLFFNFFLVGYLKRKSSSTDAEKMDIDLRMTEYQRQGTKVQA